MSLRHLEHLIDQYAGIRPYGELLDEVYRAKDLPIDSGLYSNIITSFASYYDKKLQEKIYMADKIEALGNDSSEDE